MTTLSPKLQKILDAEIAAGNTIEGSYEHAFAKCSLLVMLRGPFRVARDSTALVDGTDAFVNTDSHYPLGRGYCDDFDQTMIMAPG